jgi:CheY-like chemotaxis protein
MSQKFSVLVVEDNVDMVEIYRLVLEELNFTVVPAQSAGEALQALRTHSPEAVLLDLTLPDDASELLAAVRKLRELKRTRLIVVSGKDDVAEQASAYGADAHLRKPFDMEDLIRLLRE